MNEIELILREEYNKIKLESSDTKIDTSVTFSNRASNDKQIFNSALYSDLKRASNKAKIGVVEIGYIKTGHGQYVAGKNVQSRHWTGNAVDINTIYVDGVLVTHNSNPTLWKQSIDKLVDELKSMGYVYGEGRNKKAYIWQSAGHYNHLHVSNIVNKDLAGIEDVPDKESDTENKSEEWETIDYIQTVLDWVGFIPVIGDILDIVNACIYFYREKYIDGALSLIAIIPVAGSVISMGLKGALKGMRASLAGGMIKMALKGDTAKWQGFLKRAIKDGKIKYVHLKQMAKWGDEASRRLTMSSRALRKYEKQLEAAGLPPEAVAKTFDNWAFQVQKLLGSAGDVSKLAKTRKVAGKVIKAPFKMAWTVIKLPFKIVHAAMNIVTLGTWNMARKGLKTLFGAPAGKSVQLVNGLKYVYKTKLTKDPMLAAQMIKANLTTPTKLSKLPIGKNIDVNSNTNDIYLALKSLKQSNPKGYKTVIEQVAKQSDNSNNIWYREFVANQLHAAYMITKPGAAFKGTIDGNILNVFKNIKYGLKSWDVISNEIQDLAERFGIKKTDDPNAVIVPLMISSVLYLSGDKDTEKDDIKPEDIVTKEQQEEIMELYNSVDGETTKEKVKNLMDKDISEIAIWATLKAAGIG